MFKQIIGMFIVFGLSGCGGSSGGGGGDSSNGTTSASGTCDTTLTFAKDIAPLVADSGAAHCGSCHNHTSYSTLSGLQNSRSSSYSQVAAGSMPQDSKTFNSTASGKTFLNWMACSTLK